jgi:hypothetical protein
LLGKQCVIQTQETLDLASDDNNPNTVTEASRYNSDRLITSRYQPLHEFVCCQDEERGDFGTGCEKFKSLCYGQK